MTIRLNRDKALVQEIRSALKENGGYCPCAIFKNEDTRCICKDFREQIAHGIPGECRCGLYEGVCDDDCT